MTLTMTGRITDCVLLAYRVPKREVAALVPAGLELVTRGDWAFWNVVASRIEAMRPAGLPAWCGMSYHHVAYRLYVRARGTPTPVEGLFFVRSDADNALIATTGNWLSDFRFHRAQITFQTGADATQLEVIHPDATASLRAHRVSAPPVSADSCFASRAEAERFLKYRPLGLALSRQTLRLAEVFRNEADWHETPLAVEQARFQFLEQFGPHELELATQIAPVDYRWRLGKTINLQTTNQTK